MKGGLTFKFLELIENSIFAVSDIFTIFTLPYGTSFNKMNRILTQKQIARGSLVEELRQEFQKKKKLSDLLYRLKRDGLVEIKETNNKKALQITGKGANKLLELKSKLQNKPESKIYRKEPDSEVTIVAYDIPEQEKFKREWLRSVLAGLEFKMIQKSVWVGKNKITEELITDLDKLKLLSYVAIFKVTKSGTIEKI